MTQTPPATYRYRFNVGIALFNTEGQVWLGKAISDGPEYVLPGHEWQMPQGGIDPSEDIIIAARRELYEETGITAADYLAVTETWVAYDFPQPYALHGHRLEVFLGQQQRFVAFRFTGDERMIDLGATGPGFAPEFSEWRWASLKEAVAGVMPYKRVSYAAMAQAFRRFAAAD